MGTFCADRIGRIRVDHPRLRRLALGVSAKALRRLDPDHLADPSGIEVPKVEPRSHADLEHATLAWGTTFAR